MSAAVAEPWHECDLSVRVRRAEVTSFRARIEEPVRTAFGVMHDRPALFVRVEDDAGGVGVGEVWCNFPACGAEHRARLLESVVLPLVVAQRFEDPPACFAQLSQRLARLAVQAGEPGPLAQCTAGVDLALWDLVARRHAAPLYRLFAGDPDIAAYASGINPGGAAATVERCRAAGHRAFKLKIGFGREEDRANVAAIVQGLHAGERFMVDANQAWTLDEAVDAVRELAAMPLGWLEEPLMADADPAHWRALKAACPIPLAGGENLLGTARFADAIDAGVLDVVQPDLCKWGGISGCLPVARRALAAGRCFCPHYLGGGVGLAGAAHLLAAAGGGGLLEMDCNPNPLRDRLFAPSVHGGRVSLGGAPGLGIDPDALAALDGDGVVCTARMSVGG